MVPLPSEGDPPEAIGGHRPKEASAGAGAPDVEESTLVGDLQEVERAKPERAFNVGMVLGVLVAMAAAVFIVQNSQSAGFDWLWFDFSMPLWAALVGAIAVGVILTATALAVHHRRRRRIGRRTEATDRLRRFLSRNRGSEQAPSGRRHRPMGSDSPA